MNVTITKFSGSSPRVADHLVPKGSASEAVDCDFSTGDLDSFREPLPYREVSEGTKFTYQHECCWHDFMTCVDLAYGSITCKDVFVTGAEDYPVALTVSTDKDGNCLVKQRRLGVLCPTNAPSVIVGSPNKTSPKDVDGRTYAYQYINSVGERSQLSPGSMAQNVRDGQTCIISGWIVPSEEWDVTTIAIYRSVPMHMKGNENENPGNTSWMLVDEIPVTDTVYTDSKWNVDLLYAAEETMVLPPPEGLRGIIWIESTNSLMGYVGNRIYASENNQYHNWPYYYDLDDNVCGLVENGGVVYVATDGNPYVLAGKVGCDNQGCRDITRLHGSFPMVGCGNRRMAKCSAGAVYPSHKGLILLSGKTAPTILTWPLYTETQWQALRPHTAIPVEVGGKLFVFAEGGSFYMTLQTGSEKGWTLDSHCSLSDKNVTDAFVSRQGDFYIVKHGVQMLWNRGAARRPHKFRTTEIITNAPVGWAAGNLIFKLGMENVKIELDDRIVMNREVLSSRVFRLPMYAMGQRMVVTLTGTGKVSLMSIATSMKDLGAS